MASTVLFCFSCTCLAETFCRIVVLKTLAVLMGEKPVPECLFEMKMQIYSLLLYSKKILAKLSSRSQFSLFLQKFGGKLFYL